MSDIQYMDYEPPELLSNVLKQLKEWYDNHTFSTILYKNDPILTNIPWYRSPAISANIPIRKIWAAERELKNWTKRLRKEARLSHLKSPKERV